MANRTDPFARSVHGTNPQNLVEKILRMKIYSSLYWKEHCFGLTAESLVDKAVQIRDLGGTFGGAKKPTNFMCLILKLLQLQPDKEIITEFIKNDDYKYVRILGAFYLRLVGRPVEVYQYLEPVLNDNRKVRLRQADGSFQLSHIDELIDQMLHGDYMFDVALPRLPSRLTLERMSLLEQRVSVLEENFDEEALAAEADAEAKAAEGATEAARKETEKTKEAVTKLSSKRRSRSHSHERARPEAPRERRHRSRSRDRHRSRSRDRREKERGGAREGRDVEPRERGGEKDRGGKDRERGDDRDRERGSRRDRDRDDRDGGGREREDRDRDRKRRRSASREGRRDGGRGKDREPREKPKDKAAAGDRELPPDIVEANALRASLGLKPLRM